MGRPRNPVTVDDLAAIFPGIRHLQSRLAPLSLDDYLADATMYVRFCQGDAARISDPDTLLAWREHMVHHTEYSPNTINRRLMAIKALVKASARIERFDVAAALKFQQIELVKVISLRHRLKQHARVRLEPEDVRRLCTLPDPTTTIGLRDRVLLNVLATSGCRIAEVLSLSRHDVMKRSGGYFVQVVGKGRTEPRLAPLSCQAHEWVERWLSVRDQHVRATALITAVEPYTGIPLGHRISADNARVRLKRYASVIGLPHVKPHDFRRFVATQIAEKYGIRQAQLALGHASPEMTARYYVMDELKVGLTDNFF
jgi:integrase